METKKLISAVAFFALAANLGLASIASAASTGTGSAAIGAGGYNVNVTDTVSLSTDTQSDDGCDDGPMSISLIAFDACGAGQMVVQDLDGVNTDRTINLKFNRPLTDSVSSVALPLVSTSGFGINIEAAADFLYSTGGAGSSDFTSVTSSDRTKGSAAMLLLNTNTAVVDWAKGGNILNFSAQIDFTLQQDIPDANYTSGGNSLSDGTYTNTLTFTAS